MPRVVILCHAHDRDNGVSYFVRALVERWQARGIACEFVYGAERFVPADVAILHLDITKVPYAYRRLARRYPRVVNGATNDISKRRVSRHVLWPWSRTAAPVIVKSNRNFGGRPEAAIAARRARESAWYRPFHLLGRRLPPTWRGEVHPARYPIYPTAVAVPWRWRWNPRLVVEPFQPERHDDLYVLRQWVFFGDQGIGQVAYATSPIVKADSVVRRESDDHVPAALRDVREQLGFDYGKIDWAMVNGAPVVYDVNRTPTIPGGLRQHHGVIADRLGRGLDLFFA